MKEKKKEEEEEEGRKEEKEQTWNFRIRFSQLWGEVMELYGYILYKNS